MPSANYFETCIPNVIRWVCGVGRAAIPSSTTFPCTGAGAHRVEMSTIRGRGRKKSISWFSSRLVAI